MTHSEQLVATIAITVCWVTFASVWVIGAVYNGAKGPKRSQRRMMPNSYLAIVGAAVVVLIVVAHAVPGAAWTHLRVDSPWTTGIGLTILALSTAFTLWGRSVLGTMWSMETVLRENHQLRTAGPYGITRNPIYTGLLGMLLGSVLLAGLGSWILILPLAVVIFEAKIHNEERLMAATFHVDYPRYRERVPQLIPLVRWRLALKR